MLFTYRRLSKKGPYTGKEGPSSPCHSTTHGAATMAQQGLKKGGEVRTEASANYIMTFPGRVCHNVIELERYTAIHATLNTRDFMKVLSFYLLSLLPTPLTLTRRITGDHPQYKKLRCQSVEDYCAHRFYLPSPLALLNPDVS